MPFYAASFNTTHAPPPHLPTSHAHTGVGSSDAVRLIRRPSRRALPAWRALSAVCWHAMGVCGQLVADQSRGCHSLTGVQVGLGGWGQGRAGGRLGGTAAVCAPHSSQARP